MRIGTVLLTLAGTCLVSIPVTAIDAAMPMHMHCEHSGEAVGDRLGVLTFPNSGKVAAQAPFLRGVKLLHNFQYPEAIAAFHQAQKIDPNFAMAYWGEAMAHNYTLWAEQHYGEARDALNRLAPTPEARAAKARTARERAWLGAVETLYGPGTKFARDEAYADRMDLLAKNYPDDVEAQVFDALATLGRSHGKRDTAGYMKGAAMLEELFPTHRDHPGVVHYLIHAYDDPAHAPLGMRAARLYDRLAPDSPHAQHMTSHIFLAMGMWPDVERANDNAARVAAGQLRAKGRDPLATMGCGHGSLWKVYAMQQEAKDVSGELAQCRRVATSSAALAADSSVIGDMDSGLSNYADMLVREGVETGRWPAPDAVVLRPGHDELARFTLANGRVLAARHDYAAARAALAEMQASRAALAAAFPKEAPDDDQSLPWLDRSVAEAQAIVLLARGDEAGGLDALRSAADAEAALPPPFGPPVMQKPSAELLGDEYLALGRKVEAAAAYRAVLAAAPGRRLAVAGLALATH